MVKGIQWLQVDRWLGIEPAFTVETWEVFPTDQCTLLFRHTDSSAYLQLHTFGDGRTELEFLSTCCKYGISRTSVRGREERYCRACGETLLYTETDGALSGENYWGLEGWLVVEGVPVLTAGLSASLLLDLCTALGNLRASVHRADLEKYGDKSKEELRDRHRAEFCSYLYPQDPWRLYWPLDVLNEALSLSGAVG